MITNPIIPKDLFDLAEKITIASDLSSCEKSAIERTSADRAYYSAFLHAREWIKDNHPNDNNLINKSADHKIVREDLGRLLGGHIHTVNSTLRSLRKIRNDASYDLTRGPFNSEIGEISIEEILDDCNFVLTSL